MNGRIYDPLLGRFLSADILIQNPGNLQSFNRYSYIANNPLSGTDPSGFADTFQDWVKKHANDENVKKMLAAMAKAGVTGFVADVAKGLVSVVVAKKADQAQPGGASPHVEKSEDGQVAAKGDQGRVNSQRSEVNGQSGPQTAESNTNGQKDPTVSAPDPTEDQIAEVWAKWGKFFKLDVNGFAAPEGSRNRKIYEQNVHHLKRLVAQAFLFRRPNGNLSICMQAVVNGLSSPMAEGQQIVLRYDKGGTKSTTDQDEFGRSRSSIGGSSGLPEMVSIMHELVHAVDFINAPTLLDKLAVISSERHLEIYRMHNQTMHDLGLPMTNGPQGMDMSGMNPGKYNGSGY